MCRIILIAWCFFTATANAKDTITWVTENFEPYFIQAGPMAGQGIADRSTAALIAELPEYEHRSEYMPILRITSALSGGENVVVNSYLKNPKDKNFAIYSICSMVVPPLELTLRKTDWLQKWQGAKVISLDAFLSAGNVVGVAGRRYYGDKLTPILQDKRFLPKGIYVMQSTHYRNLAGMVSSGRLDATIGYAAELKFYEMDLTEKGQLVSLPILENPDFLYAYVVLPKTPWGEELKRHIDEVLLKVRATDAYKSIFYDWFGKSEGYAQAIDKRFASKE